MSVHKNTVKHLAIIFEKTAHKKMTVAGKFYGCQIYWDHNKLMIRYMWKTTHRKTTDRGFAVYLQHLTVYRSYIYSPSEIH